MKVEVSFQIEEDKWAEAVRRMAELVEGSAQEHELEPLLEAIDTALVLEVEEGCEE
jgi:hypothetical protein